MHNPKPAAQTQHVGAMVKAREEVSSRRALNPFQSPSAAPSSPADSLADAINRLVEQHAQEAARDRPEWMRDKDIRSSTSAACSRAHTGKSRSNPTFPRRGRSAPGSGSGTASRSRSGWPSSPRSRDAQARDAGAPGLIHPPVAPRLVSSLSKPAALSQAPQSRSAKNMAKKLSTDKHEHVQPQITATTDTARGALRAERTDAERRAANFASGRVRQPGPPSSSAVFRSSENPQTDDDRGHQEAEAA